MGNTQLPCPGTTWHLLCCPSASRDGPLPGREVGRKAGADQTAAAALGISPCLSLQSLRETFSLLSLAAFGSISPGETQEHSALTQGTALTRPCSFKYLNPHCFPPWAFDPAPKLERFCPGQIPQGNDPFTGIQEQGKETSNCSNRWGNAAGKFCSLLYCFSRKNFVAFCTVFPHLKLRRWG